MSGSIVRIDSTYPQRIDKQFYEFLHEYMEKKDRECIFYYRTTQLAYLTIGSIGTPSFNDTMVHFQVVPPYWAGLTTEMELTPNQIMEHMCKRGYRALLPAQAVSVMFMNNTNAKTPIGVGYGGDYLIMSYPITQNIDGAAGMFLLREDKPHGVIDVVDIDTRISLKGLKIVVACDGDPARVPQIEF